MDLISSARSSLGDEASSSNAADSLERKSPCIPLSDCFRPVRAPRMSMVQCKSLARKKLISELLNPIRVDQNVSIVGHRLLECESQEEELLVVQHSSAKKRTNIPST